MTALVGATVIDGTGSKPFRHAVVLVSGERISAVGPRPEVIIPEGALVVDLTGKWIIPDLVEIGVTAVPDVGGISRIHDAFIAWSGEAWS